MRAESARGVLLVALVAGVLAVPAERLVAAPEGAAVGVVTLDRKTTTARFASLGPEALRVVPKGASAVTIPLDSIREARFSPEAIAPPPYPRLRVSLVGGEEIVAEYWSPAEEGITLRGPGIGELTVPFDLVRTMVTVPTDAGPCHDPAEIHGPKPGSDVAYLGSGDEIRGTVSEAAAEGLVLELERGQRRTILWADLLVAQMENPAPPPPKGALVEVETADGSRLLSEAASGDEATGITLTLRSDGKTRVVVPLAAVSVLRFSGGRFAYASDLPFESAYTHYNGERLDAASVAFLANWYRVRADRHADGCPLRMNGVGYRHGFSAHSRSGITLRLGKAWKTFEADFGIDDGAKSRATGAPGGNVDARILGDGKVLWEATGVKGGEAPRVAGPVDVAGVDVLVLVVDFGQGQNELDRAVWGSPILVRK